MPLVNEPNEAYHASDPVSKTTLWTMWSKTPFHARFGVRKPTSATEFGSAAHLAVLEPDAFEARVYRGPDVRKNTNEWKRFEDMCAAHHAIGLKPDEYDLVIAIRDTAHTIEPLRIARSGQTLVEQSAYGTDPETGIAYKTRPDLFNVPHGIMLDLKNMASASAGAFQRDVGKFGYHVQRAMYPEVWENATGMAVEAFFFVVLEKSEPPTFACYELSPSAIAEGHAIYRSALSRYAECLRNDDWPGYPSGVQMIGLRKYDYRLTPAPDGEEIQEMGENE